MKRHFCLTLIAALALTGLSFALRAESVLSYHNDSSSTGVNPNETILTPSNLTTTTFSKQFAVIVDGQVYAQLLYLPAITVVGGSSAGPHNLAIVATQHDSLYAIDVNSGNIVWQTSFLTNGLPGATTITSMPATDSGTTDTSPEIGICGTPVIDPTNSKYLYVAAKTKQILNGNNATPNYVYTLYQVDITNGNATPNANILQSKVIADTAYDGTNYTYRTNPDPTVMAGVDPFVAGTGDGAITVGGQSRVYFNALRQMNRPALFILGNSVYVAFGSHGDNGPYHGWLLGFDTTQQLQLSAVLNLTPNGGLGGIWGSGAVPVVDSHGSIFLATGNGAFDGYNNNGSPAGINGNGFPVNGDYGDCFLRIVADAGSTQSSQNINGWGLTVADYFSPFNNQSLDSADTDLGSGGCVLLPDSAGSSAHPHLLLGAGKQGNIYLIDRDSMGKFMVATDNVVQSQVAIGRCFDTPAFFNGNFFYFAEDDNGKAFSISNAAMSTTPLETPDTLGFPGATPSISANGINNGIIWVTDRNTNQLRAYAAPTANSTALTELWTSGQAPNNRDQLGTVAKFTATTVADGMVMVGTANSFVVYGPPAPPSGPPAAPSNLAATAISALQINLNWTDNANNEAGFSVEQSSDGGQTYTQIATVGVNITSYPVTQNLQAGTLYYFRVRSYNTYGPQGLTYSNYCNPASAATTAQMPTLNFTNGFAGSTSTLQYNGTAAIVNNRAELTNISGSSEAASIWSLTKQNVQAFSTQFTFQLTNAAADGFTFALQNNSPAALGPLGGDLGYTGIPNSLAIKFDLYDQNGQGGNSTGIFYNGAAPTSPYSDLTPYGIDLHSGDVMSVTLNYDGTTLTETVTDTVTGNTASFAYTVNIPATIGSSTAYVGFTGGTGGSVATQDILTWQYAPLATAVPAAPSNLVATAASGTQINLTWVDNSAGTESGFIIMRGSSPSSLAQAGVAATGATTYSDSGLNSNLTYYYEVIATNNIGNSQPSNVASALTPIPPDTPSNAHATAITATSISMSWTPLSSNETGYNILRNNTSVGGNAKLVATLPPGSTSYTDTTVSPGTSYDYHIQAFNLGGYSDFAGFTAVTLSLPTITVSSSGGPLAVNGVATGQITFTAASTQAAALPISYTISGTANPGTDYAAVSGTATIPAGSTSVTVPITAAAGATPNSTVTLSIATTATYVAGTSSSATVTLESSTFNPTAQNAYGSSAVTGAPGSTVTLTFQGLPGNPAGTVYVWYLNGTAIATTTTGVYTLTNAQAAQSGTYSVYAYAPGGVTGGASFTVTVGTVVPSPFTDTDIGGPGQTGSASVNTTTGVYTVNGGGADMYGSADQFNFYSEPLTADTTFIVHIDSQQATDPWAKAGLMFRNSLAAGAANVAIVQNPGGLVEMQWRDTDNALSNWSGSQINTGASTLWLKLVKSGTTFSGYFAVTAGVPGVNDWILIANHTTTFTNSTYYAGLAVTAHNNNLLGSVVYSHFNYTNGATAPTPMAAVSAKSFLSSIGICTHVTQGRDDPTKIGPLMTYAGIANVRDDGTTNASILQSFVNLHNTAGIKYCLLPVGGDITDSIAQYEELAAAGGLMAVEGPNELNNYAVTYNGQSTGSTTTFLPGAQFQRDLYTAVKADSKLAGIPVFAPSEAGGSEPDNVGFQYITIPTGADTEMPDGTVYGDYANTHNYLSNNNNLSSPIPNTAWGAEDPTLNGAWDGMYVEYSHTWNKGFNGYPITQLPSLPRVTTETGWVTASTYQGEPTVTQDQQGKLFLNLFLDAYRRGWSYTFIYMLRDDASQGYWGLFDTNNNPKLSGTYLHNFTSILADGATATPGSLSYAIPNEPITVHDMLIQKSNGTFELAVWDEEITGTDTVTVNLGTSAPTVNVYDPTVGATPTSTLSNVTSIPLTLSDHPVILEIGAPPPPPPLPIVSVTSATGPLAVNGLATGQLTFTSNGAVSASLPITYTVSGTARAGVDYLGLSGTAVIAAGSSSVTVPVTAQPGATPNATVAASIATTSTYQAGTPASATVALESTTFNASAQTAYGSGNVTGTVGATVTLTFQGLPNNPAGTVYVWYLGGTAFATTTTGTYALTNAQVAQSGTYSVYAYAPGGVTGSASYNVTISNPVVTIQTSTPTLTVNDGSSKSFTVSLASAPTATVTIAVGITGTPDLTVSPPTLSLTPANYQNQTVTVNAGAINSNDSNRSATVSLSAPGATGAGVAVTDAISDAQTAANLTGTSAALAGTNIGTGAGDSSVHASGNWWIDGSGTGGLSGTADGFHLESQSFTGNFQMVVQLQNLVATGATAPLAGLMIRDGTAAGANFLALAGTTAASGGYSLLSRTTVGAATSSTVTSGTNLTYTYPNAWMMLSRVGSVLHAFVSSDGVNYYEVTNPATGVTWTGMGSALNLGVFSSSGNSANARAVMSNFAIIPATTTTSSFTDADIGSPGKAGSASVNSSTGIYTVSGGGADIYGASDQFNFYSEPVTGDGTLIAHVDSQTNTSVWAKAGLMFRNSLSAGAAWVGVFQNPGNLLEVQWRDSDNAQANWPGSQVTSAVAANWLKLVKSGTTYSAYYATTTTVPTSANWILIATHTTSFTNSTCLAGLAVTSHDNTQLGTAVFSQFTYPGSNTAPALPIVSVTSTGPVAVNGVATGQITFTSNSAPSANLPVAYTLAGTAQAGTDYTALSGTAVIPAGATSVSVPVTALSGAAANRTVTASIATTSAYQAGTPSSATVVLEPTSFNPTAQNAYGTSAVAGSTGAAVTLTFPGLPGNPSGTAYVWYLNGTAFTTTTTGVDTLANAQPAQSGTYSVYAYAPGGATGSASYTVTITTPTASSFTDADIGSPGKAGSASVNSSTGIYTVSGGGADIYGASDQFNFYSEPVTGDGTLIAHVDSQTNTSVWAKAGLMFRNSLSAGAAWVGVFQNPGNLLEVQWRDSDNAQANWPGSQVTSAVAANWLKLVKSGTTYSAYYATTTTVPTSANWILIATHTTSFTNSTCLAGLAVTSHDNTQLGTAVFSQFTYPGSNTAPALPIVSVTSATGPLAVNGLATGQLTFTSNGAVSASLPITYTVSGTARAGVDYLGLSGTAVIAAGSSSVTVPVTAQPGATPNATVAASIATTSTYQAGTPASATVALESTTFNASAQTAYGSGNVTGTVGATVTLTFQGLPNNPAGTVYVWYLGGTAFATTTTGTYALTNAQVAQSGTYSVYAYAPGGVTGSASYNVTISNPVVTIQTSTPTLTVNDGSSKSFTVSLASAPTATVTIAVGITGTPDLTVSPPTLSLTPANYQNQTVTVNAGAINSNDSNRSATVSLSAPGATGAGVAVTDAISDAQTAANLTGTSAALAGTNIGTGAGDSSVHASGNWWIDGSGTGGLSGTADGFHLESQSFTGNFQMVVQLQNLVATGATAPLAGLMIRDGTAAGANFLALAGTTAASGGYSLLSRTTVGAATSSTVTSGTNLTYTYPNAWMMLSRVGSVLHAFVSSDGVNYYEVTNPATGVTWTGMGSALNLGVFSSSGNSANARAVMSNFAIIPATTTTSSFTDADIGSPGKAGSASVNSSTGIYTVSGGGADIYGASDQFNFYSEPVTGDGTLIAHVDSQTNTSVWAKAGLMFRNSLSAGAAWVGVFQNPGNLLEVQWRDSDNAQANWPGSQVTSAVAANWLKLVKSGTTYSAYYATTTTVPTSANWILIATHTTSFTNSTCLAGLAVTSHDNTQLGTAVFSQFTYPGSNTAPALPIVSVTSTGPVAVNGVATGQITFTSNSAPSANLPVAYTLAGTAQAGTDYTALSGTAVIPAGATSVSVPVTALSGAAANRTVTASIATTSAYQAGTPSSATVVLEPTSFNPTAQNAYGTSAVAGSTGAAVTLTFPGLPGNPSGTAYVWYLNGTAFTTTTTGVDTLANAQPAQSGTYSVYAYAPGGATGSASYTVTITTPTASSFTDADIGSPGKAGSASVNSSTGIYTVSGGGADIYGASDQFNFYSEPVTGDGTLIAHVDSQTNTSVWAKAGLMFRNSLSAGAAWVGVFQNPGNLLEVQWRDSDNAQANWPGSQVTSAVAANWLKLVKSGTTYSAYYATTTTVPTSANWILIATHTTSFTNSTCLAGLAVTSHDNTQLGTAVFSGFTHP